MTTLTQARLSQNSRSPSSAKSVRNYRDHGNTLDQKRRSAAARVYSEGNERLSTSSALRVDSDVPFGDCIYWWLRLTEGHDQDLLYRESHQFDRQYLAWEMVRKARNPYFDKGTGFEGYFVGSCQSSDEALRRIVQLGQDVWRSIVRLYPFDYRFHRILRKTLSGEQADLKALAEWSAQLGAVLAKLRCNLLTDRAADAFRAETYRVITALPPLDYREGEHSVRQTYMLDAVDLSSRPRLIVNGSGLAASDQDGWRLAESIGKFGHPLLRAFIRRGGARW